MANVWCVPITDWSDCSPARCRMFGSFESRSSSVRLGSSRWTLPPCMCAEPGSLSAKQGVVTRAPPLIDSFYLELPMSSPGA